MKSNRIVVFAASQRCTDEVKVVLGGPQVSDVGDLRNLPQKINRESEGRFAGLTIFCLLHNYVCVIKHVLIIVMLLKIVLTKSNY